MKKTITTINIDEVTKECLDGLAFILKVSKSEIMTKAIQYYYKEKLTTEDKEAIKTISTLINEKE